MTAEKLQSGELKVLKASPARAGCRYYVILSETWISTLATHCLHHEVGFYSDLSIRDQWARYHVYSDLKDKLNKSPTPGLPTLRDDEPLPQPPQLDLPVSKPTVTPPKVCIIGAGAAGLFTALLLDYLNECLPEFHVEYDIFESSATVGGRLYTYNFSDAKDPPHDYYDVGAMRFPENPIMKRTFRLFEYLRMHKVSEPNPKPPPYPPKGSIIPYYMQGVNEPWCFNHVNQTGTYCSFAECAPKNDPFKMNIHPTDRNLERALEEAARSSPNDILGCIIKPFTDAMKEDPVKGWEFLMRIDKMSTTEFLASEPLWDIPEARVKRPQTYNTIEWLETFGGGSNWYDQAHSETVLEHLDFSYSRDTEWWCIEGDAQQLAFKMAAKLKNQSAISYDSRITGIDVSVADKAKVKLNGQYQGHYAGVFNSTSLGCMQQMDLRKAGLTYGQKQAIRSLGYGASAKVGMKFREPWWITEFGIKEGGLGHSDLPIRTTVYPSYNIHDFHDWCDTQDSREHPYPTSKSAVLLCSYKWQQDAQRIGTLISSSSCHETAREEEAALKELVLRDLALLHAHHHKKDLTPEQVYEMIAPLYVDHYAHDWYHNPNTFGAFAFFRPQQFSSMWPSIIAPSPSLVMIGEHASNHHAWVVGALESAVHGVHGWLTQNTFYGAAAAARKMESWEEPTRENPFGGLPPFANEKQRGWQRFFGLNHEEEFRKALAEQK